MRPDRRGPLDSHVGMMLFKNGVPVAYGGGWPFAGSCRIGVNVFAAVPRRRVGAAVRPGAPRLPPALRRRALRRRAVAIRRHEQAKGCGRARSGSTTGWASARSSARIGAARGRRVGRGMQADPALPHADRRRCAASPARDIELAPRRDDARPASLRDLSAAVTGMDRRRFAGDRAAAERAALRIVAARARRAATERWPDGRARRVRRARRRCSRRSRDRALARRRQRALVALDAREGRRRVPLPALAARGIARLRARARRGSPRAGRARVTIAPARAPRASRRMARLAPRARPLDDLAAAQATTAPTRPQFRHPRPRRVRGAHDPQGHADHRVPRRAHDLGRCAASARTATPTIRTTRSSSSRRRPRDRRRPCAATPRAGSTTRARPTARPTRTTTAACSSRRAARSAQARS